MSDDLKIIQSQPSLKIWGEHLDELEKYKVFKGKFVMTDDHKLFAKLFPKSEWDGSAFFHDMLVEELGVNTPKSMEVQERIIGGGKMEVELVGNHLECRLWGKSTIYGDYESSHVDTEALEHEIQDVFNLDDMPVQVIPDYEE